MRGNLPAHGAIGEIKRQEGWRLCWVRSRPPLRGTGGGRKMGPKPSFFAFFAKIAGFQPDLTVFCFLEVVSQSWEVISQSREVVSQAR